LVRCDVERKPTHSLLHWLASLHDDDIPSIDRSPPEQAVVEANFDELLNAPGRWRIAVGIAWSSGTPLVGHDNLVEPRVVRQ
jgi:hypothetical protein